MKIGTRVKCGDAVGTVADGSMFDGFVNMRGKVYVKWDKPRGEKHITSETIKKSQLTLLKG